MAGTDGILGDELTGDEICKIIATCGENDVESVIYGKLNVVFKTKPLVLDKLAIESPSLDYIPSNEVEQDRLSEEANLSLEQSIAAQQLEELYITDPLAAETMLANGELEDA